MDFRRALLSISLGLVLLLIWQAWLDFDRSGQSESVPVGERAQLDSELPATPVAQPQTQPSAVPEAPDAPAAPDTAGILPQVQQETGTLITVETDLLKVNLDTVG